MDQNTKLKKELKKWKGVPGALLQVLRAAQDIYGYLSPQVMLQISKELNVPLSQVYGVATFYHYFKFKKPGVHKIKVCTGTACYIKGSGAVIEALEKLLKIKEGDTTSDGMFSLEAVRCLGCCGLAPVMLIDDQVYGNVTPTKAEEIVKRWMRGEVVKR